MNVRLHAARYACPVSNEIRPPSPPIQDGCHTALERRFEEEIVREEELRFVSPRRTEDTDRRFSSS